MSWAEKLAPVEHRVTFLGKDPITPDWRVRCECGWTEKYRLWFKTGPENDRLAAHNVLMVRWEKHVYTPDEILLLQELGG